MRRRSSRMCFYRVLRFLKRTARLPMPSGAFRECAKCCPPKAGLQDWEITAQLANALGYDMHYAHPSEIMAEIAALTPTFAGVSYEKLDRLGSIQWPCNAAAPDGTSTMHVDNFVRGKGKFYRTEYVPTAERTTSRYPLILTTGRVLSQYNVGAQTAPHRQCRMACRRSPWKFIRTMPKCAVSSTAIGLVSPAARATRCCARMSPLRFSLAWCTRRFIFRNPGANVITTDNSDWATNCPEYKVTAVQVCEGLPAVRMAAPASRTSKAAHAH